MRLKSAESAWYSDLRSASGVVQHFTRHLRAVIGVFCLMCVVALAASLATWSINDPSWNYAIDREPSNALGYTGAIISDLMFQFIGIASMIVLIPPAVWGWRCLMVRPGDPVQPRLILWFFAIATGTVAASLLPVSSGWPLPTGLGGIVGDIFVRSLQTLTAGNTFVSSWVLTPLFIGAALVLMVRASLRSRRIRHPNRHSEDPQKTGSYYERYDQDRINDDFDDDNETDDASWSVAFFGHAMHTYYAFQSKLYRLIRGKTPASVRFDRREGPNEAYDPYMDRHEPRLSSLGTHHDGFGAHQNDDYDQGPLFEGPDSYGATVDGSLAQPSARQSVPANSFISNPPANDHGYAEERTASRRIERPAAPPRPGRRDHLEAQGSLLPKAGYEFPPLHLLKQPKNNRPKENFSEDVLDQNARILEGVLEDFGVRGEIFNVRPGPVVTLYELEPAPGIKSSRVIGLADDIARSMSAISARVAVIPGKNAIGIELPNSVRETVYLRELIASENFEKSKVKLALTLGKTINGESVIADLARMPHLLVAGTTGSGKSVSINTMILSVLYRMKPEDCKLIMIDPKMLELSVYDGIPHLLTPVVTDPKKAVVALKWTVREMEDRYKKMSQLGVRNIDGFNARVQEARRSGETVTRTVQTGFDQYTGEAQYESEELNLEPMPYIVVVVDEMADLMMVAGKDIEGAIQRLAQMARAAGIHLIMATQRPSVDVITGTIKANFPTRISFQVTSKIDSRTILGEQGAEQLLGMGDMLYMAGGGRIQRVHGPFVSDKEVESIVDHLKSQGSPQYLSGITDGDDDFDEGSGGSSAALDESAELYDRAVAIVLRDQKASTSYIQRRLSIGYNRAASLIERMEQEGVISAANHAGKREILVKSQEDEFAS